MDKMILKTHDGETWREAIERFHAFCTKPFKLEFEDEGEDLQQLGCLLGEELLKITRHVPDEEFAALEAKYNLTVPKNLKELMQEHGLFTIEECLEFFDADEDIRTFCPIIKPFLEGLQFNWTHEVAGDLLSCSMTQEQCDSLNQHLFFFGIIWYGHERCEYLCFDREGNFSTLYFESDDIHETVQKHILPILEGKAACMTLDQVIAYAVDKVIDGMIGKGNDIFSVVEYGLQETEFEKKILSDEDKEEEDDDDEDDDDLSPTDLAGEIKRVASLKLTMPALPKDGQRYLSQDLRGKYVHFKGLKHSGDFVVGRYDLDDTWYTQYKISAIYCEGDMVIDGDIINNKPDMFPKLIVTGDLYVRSWLRGGMPAFIGGSVFASGVLVGEYNDTPLYVVKDLHADAYLIRPEAEKNTHQIGGMIHARTIDLRQENARRELRKLLPEALVSDGKDIGYDSHAMIQIAAEGRSVWKKKITL